MGEKKKCQPCRPCQACLYAAERATPAILTVMPVRGLTLACVFLIDASRPRFGLNGIRSTSSVLQRSASIPPLLPARREALWRSPRLIVAQLRIIPASD
jgi:hypothetical protein